MKKHTILLVDDDPLITRGIGKNLEIKGYQVATADSGEKAFELLHKSPFDLVIADLVMEKIDGIQVLEKTKELNPETMVIIITGYGEKENIIDAFRLNVDDFLLKPLEPEELYFRVEQCLEKLKNKKRVKQAEEALRKAHEELERRVEERTKELESKTNNLEEVNTALKVLLKQRENDRTEHEEKVLFNVKELIIPFLNKLKKTNLGAGQMDYVNVLESNLNEIISPFTHRLSLKYLNLTPSEIQITNLVKQGKTSKQIANMLNLSSRTIETHRKNIREKLGLKSKKANLRSYLLSIQ